MVFCEERCHITQSSVKSMLSQNVAQTLLFWDFLNTHWYWFSARIQRLYFRWKKSRNEDSRNFMIFSNWFILELRNWPPGKNFQKLCTQASLSFGVLGPSQMVTRVSIDVLGASARRYNISPIWSLLRHSVDHWGFAYPTQSSSTTHLPQAVQFILLHHRVRGNKISARNFRVRQKG